MASLQTHSLTAFDQYPASKQLKKLAEHPFDLTQPGHLTPARLEHFCAEACGYTLLYGTERVTEEVMQQLEQLATEAHAVDKLMRMQAGEVVNCIEGYPSENRPALHTATRDFFDHPNPAPAAKEAAQLAKQEADKLKAFMQQIENRFTNLVMIGIGGSDLGPRAHYIALQHLQKPNRQVRFICNVDPDDAAAAMSGLDLAKTLVLVVSKSGTTLETTTNEAIVRSYFTQAKLDPTKHFVSISIPGSPLDDSKKYLACFHVWDWIGGRYSTTSMVGGVLLSFAFGFEVYWELLRGANAMDKAARHKQLKTNPPLVAALLGIWNRNFLHYATLGIIPYSQALLRYSAHIQQLDMESNGKRIDKQGRPMHTMTGPIIWGEPGTNAQHSFFQLLHQGTTVVPLELVGFKESVYQRDLEWEGTTSQQKLLANLLAQMLALATGKEDQNPNKQFPGNRPSHLLIGKRLTPYSLGALLSFFENKVDLQGFIWNINSFDQEGVQLGKVLANKIIERFATRNNPKKKSEPYPLADIILKKIDTL